MKLMMTIAALTLVAAGMARAATLDALDANGDGVATWDEVLAVYPDMSADTFTAADANADGALDADELAIAEEAGLMPMDET